MPSDEPARSHPSDPALNLLGSALHDSAVIVEAYGRFATTLISTLLFPYAALLPAKSTSRDEIIDTPARLPHRNIVQVVLALLIGLIIGRRLSAKRASRSL
jgi:hypothetical protein